MTSLEQWGVPLAVLAMLLLTLALTALLKRYQAYMADVRVVVRRLDTAVAEISGALDDLALVPLSRELRLTMRSDILARHQRIRGLYRRYPGITQKIRMAENALDAEGPPSPAGVGPLESERAFRKTVAALDRLDSTLRQGGTLRPVPDDVRRIFRREIGERRAEVLSRFHLVEARRHDSRGNPTKARTHLMALMQALRHHGPATEFVLELATEAEAALTALSERRLSLDSADSDVDAA